MTLEIVNAEGVPAPRDGTIFNAQMDMLERRARKEKK
jgi:hypothetical protein